MKLMATTDELKAGYMQVLQDIEDADSVLRGMEQDISLKLSSKQLEDCFQQLDGYAENLLGLDQHLSYIVDRSANDNEFERAQKLPTYSALMDLGTSAYDRLYQGYSTLCELRERRLFGFLSLAGGALILSSVLALVIF